MEICNDSMISVLDMFILSFLHTSGIVLLKKNKKKTSYTMNTLNTMVFMNKDFVYFVLCSIVF